MFCFHKWSEPKDHYQTCLKCNKKKLVPCDHVWTDVKEKHQYCTKCNQARYFPCNHRWNIINAFAESGIGIPGHKIIHMLQCANCGEIKKETHYT